MIISERQIMQLIQIAHVYLSAIDTLAQIDTTLLTVCGHHNKKHIASILMKIAEQQSQELRAINDEPLHINQPDKLIPVKCFKCKTEFLVHPLQNMCTDYVTDCDLHRKKV